MSITSYAYSTGFKSGDFHHAVLSISGTTHTLYLDGSVVQTNNSAGDIFASLTTLNQTVIGASCLFNQAFQGIIGDVRVYNQVVTATQVSNLYMNRNLIAHYPFDASVNKLTPNYATLQYDATIKGSPALTTGFIGNSALQLANTKGVSASQYIVTTPGNFYFNSTTGLTISCWVNLDSTTNTNNIMRIFDIPFVSGTQGLGVDISGTNMIYSSDIFMYVALGPIDNLSTAARTAMLYNGTRLQAGAYGIRLLYSKYTGPSIQIKNGSSGTPTDFYPALDGTFTLKTAYGGAGTSLTSFLSGAIAYVTKWYDQTGNANHATATGTTLPTLDTTSNVVDFGSTGYFTLLDGSYPTGNSSYTYVFKQGSVPSGISCAVFKGGSGINNNNGYLTYFTRLDNYLVHQWSGGALEKPLTASGTANSVIVCTYLEGTSFPSIYQNNVNIPMSANGIIRNQDATQNYLGSYGGAFLYKSTMPYFYWLPYQLNSSERGILGNT